MNTKIDVLDIIDELSKQSYDLFDTLEIDEKNCMIIEFARNKYTYLLLLCVLYYLNDNNYYTEAVDIINSYNRYHKQTLSLNDTLFSYSIYKQFIEHDIKNSNIIAYEITDYITGNNDMYYLDDYCGRYNHFLKPKLYCCIENLFYVYLPEWFPQQ